MARGARAAGNAIGWAIVAVIGLCGLAIVVAATVALVQVLI